MQTCYTYDETTKRLTPAPKYATIDGAAVISPTREQCARMTPPAYPLANPMPPAPEPPEGKIAVPDGYELVPSEPDGYVPGIEPEDLALMEWRQKWVFVDTPAPTLADFDAAMEEHLRNEREARGYTTREPDAYASSSVPRWKQDAEDWVAHRDAVMTYALTLMNEVEAGIRPAPTMDEFKAGLPQIEWSFAE